MNPVKMHPFFLSFLAANFFDVSMHMENCQLANRACNVRKSSKRDNYVFPVSVEKIRFKIS